MYYDDSSLNQYRYLLLIQESYISLVQAVEVLSQEIVAPLMLNSPTNQNSMTSNSIRWMINGFSPSKTKAVQDLMPTAKNNIEKLFMSLEMGELLGHLLYNTLERHLGINCCNTRWFLMKEY